MRDSKPQRFVLQHKSLKVTQIATNRGKHINEAWKKVFAHNLFLISCLYKRTYALYTQIMLSNWKICFNVFNIQTEDEDFFD